MIRYCLLLALAVHAAMGQSPPKAEWSTLEILDLLALEGADEMQYEVQLDALHHLLQQPIDLNRADHDDFAALFFLRPNQISDLLAHRLFTGNYLSVYELQALESFSLEDVRKLLPFVTVRESWKDVSPKAMVRRAVDHYLLFRLDTSLEPSRGFLESKFMGSRLRYYTRYRLSRPNEYSVGFLSEKDPGEVHFLDHFAFHVQLQNKGKIRNAIAGDYVVQFGQGLVFSGGYAAGKGGEPVYAVRRSNLGIKPYTSLVEGGGFRGIAGTYRYGGWELTTMLSRKRKDAVEGEEEFGSLSSSGLHRTPEEQAKKNSLLEENIGGNITFRMERIQLGFSWLHTRFDRIFQKRNLLYNAFAFSGQRNTVLGPNLSLSGRNFSAFAEAARSSSGGYAFLAGWVGALAKPLEFSAHYRSYASHFHSFYGGAFSAGSQPTNEQGNYIGLKYSVSKAFEMSAYYDAFRFPWLKYRIDAPSIGHSYQLRLGLRPNRKWRAWAAYRSDSKWRNVTGGTLQQPLELDRTVGVISVDHIPSISWRMQTKMQYQWVRQLGLEPAHGWAILQDVEGKYRQFQGKVRMAYFSTDSYDARIYAYEDDVRYAASFPAYNGKGIRWYALLKWGWRRNLQLWLRIAQTRVSDRETLGSGWDSIPGSKKSDLRVQIMYTL